MKKTILILISILGVLFIVLSVLGRGGEYAAEKLFYRAMKINSKIIINPDVAPPALLTEVENNLNRLIAKYPKANIAKTGHMALAEFYITHKKYDKAISSIDRIAEIYKEDQGILSMAQFLRGTVYEKQNNWPKAIVEFETLRNKYPTTQLGIQIPLYTAKYYDAKGQDAEARSAYREARLFYEKVENDYSGKIMGYIASTMLVQTFLSSRDYEKAGEALEYAMNKYPSSMSAGQLIPFVDMIFVDKLNKPARAISIYKNIQEKFNDKKVKKALQKRIDALEAKKEKS